MKVGNPLEKCGTVVPQSHFQCGMSYLRVKQLITMRFPHGHPPARVHAHEDCKRKLNFREI